MAKYKDRAALDKVVRARTNLLVSNGFFGFLAMQLRLIEVINDDKGAPSIGGINTAAVDGFNMYYNTSFIHKCTDREVEGLVAHEVMHCCFQHFSRRQHRDPMIWNMAGDHVINLDLLDSGFTLPNLARIFANPNSAICADPKYKNMNTEAVYDDLMKNVTIIKVTFAGNGDPGGCGAVMDAPGGATGEADASQQWETSLRTALNVAQANIGSIPGSLRKLVEQLKAPKVSWRELTRRFIDNSMIKDVSWSRISRRSVSIGALLPGMISDRLQHLVFFVDISGSISFELCREMVSECAGALDQGTADMVTVVYADTHVKHVDHYQQGDIITAGRYDGGGTDFADSFRWLKENAPNASCVIYLTDLCVHNFGEEPPCPVLWAVYTDNHNYDKLASNVPFGSCIHVSSYS